MTAAGAKLRMERESREQAQKQGEEMARKAGAQLDKTVCHLKRPTPLLQAQRANSQQGRRCTLKDK